MHTRNRGSGLLLLISVAALAALSLGPRVARWWPRRVEPSAPAAAHFALSEGRALLDVNAASAAELEELPEIGPVLARRILEYRDQNGDFASVDQLTEVSGIGPAVLERIRPLVTVADEAPEALPAP